MEEQNIEDIAVTEELTQLDKDECVICKESYGITIKPNCHRGHIACLACITKSKNTCPLCRKTPWVKLYCLNCGRESDSLYKDNLCANCQIIKLEEKLIRKKIALTRANGAILHARTLIRPFQDCYCRELAEFLHTIKVSI